MTKQHSDIIRAQLEPHRRRIIQDGLEPLITGDMHALNEVRRRLDAHDTRAKNLSDKLYNATDQEGRAILGSLTRADMYGEDA